MREILFRGKCIDNGEWVYGCLDLDPDLKRASICGFDYYTDPEDGPQRAEFCVPVIPETVGQYTGLTDKNGTKIFEGDIVQFERFSYKYNGKIVFNKKTCAFELWFTTAVGGYGAKARHSVLLCHVDDIKIIGNVWDNPELLEGETE